MNKKRLLIESLVLGCIFLLLNLQITLISAQDENAAAAERLTPVIHFRHLTSDDGLAQNSVNAILQDRRGFMWFGTTGGLSSYDGYHFVTYRNETGNPNSLSLNWVRDLYEDRDGMIWIATEGGGVNKFDPSTATFTRYLPDRNNPNSLPGDRILQILQDRTGQFWFTGIGTAGVTRFDPVTETYTRFGPHPDIPDGFKGGSVRDLLEDDEGHLWMVATSLLAEYDPLTDTFTYYDAPLVNEQQETILTSVQRGDDGTLWVGGGKALYQFNPADGVFTPYTGLRGINDLTEDGAGGFWVATGSGLYQFDPHTHQITSHSQQKATQIDSLSSNDITRLYQDEEGMLWIGTSSAGLNLYNPRQALFTNYAHDPDAPVSLASSTSSAIYTAGEVVWLGAGNVLDRVDLSDQQVMHYSLEEQGISGEIKAVYQDHAGVIWIGMNGLKLFQFDPATEAFTEYPLTSGTERPTPGKSIVEFYEDKAGDLWFAVDHDGLYRLDATRTKLDFYESPPSLSSVAAGPITPNTPRPPIADLFGDPSGKIWVASWNGFSKFDPATGTYQQYRARAGNTGPDSYMEAILGDQQGLIWVASRDGLIRFDPVTESFRYYTETDGLPANFTVGILEDTAGNLWISTKKGITRFTPATETFRNFDSADGLQGSEFSAHIFAQTSAGALIFGGAKGLNVFYPDQITDNEYLPNVVLTNFQLDYESVTPGDDSVLSRPITETTSISLDYGKNILSFEFAALSYAAPHKNRYRYQLEGFDEKWHDANSNRRFGIYTNLPAGNYVLRVQATNDSGLWSDHEVALNLAIQPPWWEMLWFRALLVLAAIAVILAGYQWRVYAMARQNRLLASEVARQTHALQERTRDLQASEAHLRLAKEAAETANRAKSAFLANMSHELRSPLNVILGFTQVTNRNPSLSREVHENLGIILRSGEHLLALINQVLDLSKIEAGQMLLNETDFDLMRMLDDLEEMFILRADTKRLQLVFDLPSDLPHYLRADAVKLRQVFINLIGNALKFTDTGTITVRARRLDTPASPDANAPLQLQFEVADTGHGIPADELPMLFQAFTQTTTGRHAQEGTGLGLSISRKFVELMGGTITVTSTVGQGTTFTFHIQCQQIMAIESDDSLHGNHVVGLEPNQPQYRILAVDDKWVNRQLLIKLLKPLGFDIREAENGQEALDITQAFQPHLIWMDMRMPVMDGLEATRQLKAMSLPQMPVIIALTASAFDEEQAEIIATGCDDFLRKPFRTMEIFEALHKHLGVRYIYAEDEQPANGSTELLSPDAAKDLLNNLPAALLAQLTEGTELGDIEMIEAAIAQIRPNHLALADMLTRLARRFEYDELLDMLKDRM